MLVLVAGLVVAAGIAVGIDRLVSAGGSPTSPQRILDSLVSGPDRVAPGATAYVFGPHGTWIGSAGIANVSTGERMPPDARMRIQSLSKDWLLVVMLQLARDGKSASTTPSRAGCPASFPITAARSRSAN